MSSLIRTDLRFIKKQNFGFGKTNQLSGMGRLGFGQSLFGSGLGKFKFVT